MASREIVLAAKCAPDTDILRNVKRAGITACELYLSEAIIANPKAVVDVCRPFSLRYALHAPNDCYKPKELFRIASMLEAEVVVLHDIFWDDEWAELARLFRDADSKLCIENTYTVHEPLKFMRRYRFGRCLDIEHIQMECCGVYEEEFVKVFSEASHIHMTGYVFGSDKWHTHIHSSAKHSRYLMDLLVRSGYSGFLVSEARCSLQTYDDFKKLAAFFDSWCRRK